MQLWRFGRLSYRAVTSKPTSHQGGLPRSPGRSMPTRPAQSAHPEIQFDQRRKAHGIAALRATLAGFALPTELRADCPPRARWLRAFRRR